MSGLRLKFACEEDWDGFAGEGGVRQCDRCRTRVHDLSTLTRSEATALFRSPPAGGLCVRYQHDELGRVLFRSERYPGQLAWQRFVQPPPELKPPPQPKSAPGTEPKSAPANSDSRPETT